MEGLFQSLPPAMRASLQGPDPPKGKDIDPIAFKSARLTTPVTQK